MQPVLTLGSARARQRKNEIAPEGQIDTISLDLAIHLAGAGGGRILCAYEINGGHARARGACAMAAPLVLAPAPEDKNVFSRARRTGAR